MTDIWTSNRQRDVLSLVRERGSLTRGEIASVTGLSISRVSRLTSNLLQHGVLIVEERLTQGEGRPQEVLALASNRHFIIGLDIGGLTQDIVICDLRGDTLCSRTSNHALTGSRSEILDHLKHLIEAAIEETGICFDSVLGLGAGLRAIIDPVTGVVSAGPETPAWSPAWSNFAIRDALSAIFPWPTIVVDDTVRALAIAERRLGAAIGVDDFIYVLADTGIGAALVLNGMPYIGSHHLAGEIGHVTIDPNGPLCGCGKRGCIEAYASTSALVATARSVLDDSFGSIDTLILAADSGDARCQCILAEGGEIMGRGVAMLINLLAPSLVLAGGSAMQSATYRDALITRARAETVSGLREIVRIEQSQDRPHAGAMGACSMVLDTMFLSS